MEANVRLDHTLVAVEDGGLVHAMLELELPDVPDDEQRDPINVALVIDRSGSMGGPLLHYAITAAEHLVRRMSARDRVALVAYDSEVDLLAPLGPPQPDHHAAILRSLFPRSMTNLSGGWLKGLEQLQGATGDGVRRILLLSDGHANEGITDRDRLAAMAEGSLGAGVTTTTIGFGQGFDEDLMTRMADGGGGSAHYAETAESAPGIFADEFDDLVTLAAQNVSVEIRPRDDVAYLGVLNEFPAAQVDGGIQVQLGDAWAGDRRRVVFGFKVPGLADLGEVTIADLVVRWVSVGDEVAAHERHIPVKVNVVPRDSAAGEEPDPEVREEVVLLQAAATDREAQRLADSGLLAEAADRLGMSIEALEELRATEAGSARADEMLRSMRSTGDALSAHQWDAASRKAAMYRSRRYSRGRAKDFKDLDDSGGDPQ